MVGLFPATGKQDCIVGLFLDGAIAPAPLREALFPFQADTLSVEPWPIAGGAPEALLAWLGRAFPHRPLLGLTGQMLTETGGAPLRGLSALGTGVAVVSTWSLEPGDLVGVVRHELAHALGLDHCEVWECALNERPHPLSLAGRSAELCPRCLRLWNQQVQAGAA